MTRLPLWLLALVAAVPFAIGAQHPIRYPGQPPAPIVTPDVRPHALTIVGDQFVDTVTGLPWVWRGFSDFALFQRFLNGEDVAPLLQERLALGANTLRIFCMYEGGLGHFHPDQYGTYWTSLQAFTDFVASFGLRIEWTVFADAQNLYPSTGEQVRFFNQVAATLHSRSAYVFLELVNEWPQNGVDPRQFSAPDGLLASRGSSLGDAPPWGSYGDPFFDGWAYYTWHGRRDWPKVLFSNEDAWYIGQGVNADGSRYTHPRPVVMDEDIGFAEADRSGRTSNCYVAKVLGLTSRAYGSGGTYHSDAGTGSTYVGLVQRACATAFFAALN